MKSKPVNICCSESKNGTKLFALCEDGTIWFNNECGKGWVEVPTMEDKKGVDINGKVVTAFDAKGVIK